MLARCRVKSAKETGLPRISWVTAPAGHCPALPYAWPADQTECLVEVWQEMKQNKDTCGPHVLKNTHVENGISCPRVTLGWVWASGLQGGTPLLAIC